VRTPRVDVRKVVPWTVEQAHAVHGAMPETHRVFVTLAAGLGLRQGEVFGLSPNDIDFLRGRVTVCRQVKRFTDGSMAFALPKGGKTRVVPLPASVRDEVAAHLSARPARPVTLPWGDAEGAPTTIPLVLSTRERTALNRNYFNTHIWKPTLRRAGLHTTRENGCHALRHFYASVLLDAGESIKALSEYLGHADAGFTLRTYTHLMPSSDERTRRAVDAVMPQPCHTTLENAVRG
jgi:integrase